MHSNRIIRYIRRTALVGLTITLLGGGIALAANSFDDVSPGHPHEKGIDYVADTGITVGCTMTSYCPNDPVTRAQMATFLHRASGNDPSTPRSVDADKLDGYNASDLLPALVHVGRGADDVPVVKKQRNLVNGQIPTVTGGDGFYEIDFGFDVSQRFPQCTVDTNFVDTRDAFCTVSLPSAGKVRVRIFDVSEGGPAAAEFWLTLHGTSTPVADGGGDGFVTP